MHNQEEQSQKQSKPSNTDTKAPLKERNLEKFINRSKSVCTGIILQERQYKETDSSNFFNEFQKDITKSGSKASRRSILNSPIGIRHRSFSKRKHVKFSK